MKQTIQVFYYTGPYTSTPIPAAEALLVRLSAARRERLERRVASQRALEMAALRVLELAMQLCGQSAFKLADVEYPATQGLTDKPFWNPRGIDRASQLPIAQVDFSISHAKSIVACAIARDCRVGLDVENRRAIDVRIVKRLMDDDASIADGLNEQNALARWTQIEAVLKGAGLGIMHGREIEWRERTTTLRGREWWVHPVECGPEHVVHVAVDVPDSMPIVTRIDAL